MKKILKLIISIFIPFIIGGIAGFFTSSSISTWYVGLNKPTFNPPNSIFGPVWSILYIMIGISLYFAWTHTEDKKVFYIFGIQMILNFLWSIFFFGLQLPLLALIDILLLIGIIIYMIIYYYKINKLSAYLLIPYLLWVSFATLLNFAIYILN